MTTIPVVDLQNYINHQTRDAFIQKIGDSIRLFGFVRVVGHNVTKRVTHPAYQCAKEFFSLSKSLKEKYVISGGKGQRGYTPYCSEAAKSSSVPDLKEFWHVGRQLPKDDPLQNSYADNIWPDEVENFRDDMLELYDALEDCSDLLLEALALYLGEQHNVFTRITDKGNSILRALYYPPLNERFIEKDAVRVAAHEDINFMTLLISSTSSGLQILTRENEWIDVKVEEGEVVVASGDMLSRVTNGYIPSTSIRVINPEDPTEDRYSMPFFVHPRLDSMLCVIDSCIGDDFPPPPRDIIGVDFLQQRLELLGLGG